MVIATFSINLYYSKFADDIDPVPYSLRGCSLLGRGMDYITNLLYTGTHARIPSCNNCMSGVSHQWYHFFRT